MIMKINDFMAKMRLAEQSATIYVTGGQGQPGTAANKKKMIDGYAKNQTPDRVAKINAATTKTFFFDCCGLIKSTLWGWNADSSKVRGGAVYGSNGVPDEGTEEMWKRCTNKLEFKAREIPIDKLEEGMLLYFKGHVGIYAGNGLCYDSTPSGDGVALRSVKVQPWTGAGWYPFIEKPAKAIVVGSKVQIVAGALYGGLGSGSGKPVPSKHCGPAYTVSKLATHNGKQEALIKELVSWVPLIYLK